MSQGDQSAQIGIAAFGFGQQRQMHRSGAGIDPSVLERELHAGDGLKLRGSARECELHRPGQVVVIGNGQRPIAKLSRARHQLRRAVLDDADRAIHGYVEKLTLRPASVGRDDLESLRAAGFDDRAILQINLIASWFNYINRVADGLRVGRE